MTGMDIDGTTFIFPAAWQQAAYDEWRFYRNQFMRTRAKGVDIVAIAPHRQLHLIEVKDYTHREARAVPLADLPETVAAKCVDTLGGLWAASLAAADANERSFAKASLTGIGLSVTLHINLPPNARGRLHNPQAVILNLRTKLRQAVKGIDPHARVESNGASQNGWETARTR